MLKKMQSKSYILLTGATSDIGSAIARTLCGEYPLLLHGRTQEKLQALKDELQSSNPVELWRADLSETEILKPSLKELLTSKQIPVSGFVHCAGTLKIMAFKHFREDYIREIFDVNLFSAIAVLQALLTKNNLPFMNRVVFISSLSSRRGDKGNTMYASSKGAIDALVRSLAIELAPDINVNSVLPGTIQTKMTEHLFEDATAQSPYDASKYPVGPGKCSDIASMVQFLLGEGGRWITAQNYRVDGGASTF
jgi:NAD(P)-dependent dehydrogenase (short-subunit alcohol dehydrogenase family)